MTGPTSTPPPRPNRNVDRQTTIAGVATEDRGGTTPAATTRGGTRAPAPHGKHKEGLGRTDDADDDSLDGLDAWGGGGDDDDVGFDPLGEEEERERVGARSRSGAGEMSTWSGQPAVKGSSEAMRMVLLNFSSIGIT